MPIIFFILFLVLTLMVKFYPELTVWDKTLIITARQTFEEIPIVIFTLPDCILYSIMIILPIVCYGIFFIKQKKWIDLAIICSVPLLVYLLNCIIKPFVHRARPDFDLQLLIHPHSFSYVSSHSFITLCLWGMVIYYTNKYCKNYVIKIVVSIIAVLWIFFVGISRIVIGVHYPSDVIGAWLLGITILSMLIKGDKIWKIPPPTQK